jgi:hypothetical protein
MTKRKPSLSSIVVGSLIAGLALMIPFEATITRVLGVSLLFAFIAGGVFLVAEPRFLARDRE